MRATELTDLTELAVLDHIPDSVSRAIEARTDAIFALRNKRQRRRRAESAPVLAKLREKFLEWKVQLLPKHPMAEAVNYALGQWQELTVFATDGAVPIDNNVSEQEMKRVVLNRKNSS